MAKNKKRRNPVTRASGAQTEQNKTAQANHAAATTQKTAVKEGATMTMNHAASTRTAAQASGTNEQFVWLDNAILQISPDIQRKLDPMRVAEIQRNFSPLVANPIKVSYRDGKYYIFDGMHTRAALCSINGKDSFPIFCRVYHGLTKEKEAELFATQFGSAKAVPQAYRLRALAVARDRKVLDFLKVTRGCGYGISLGSHISRHGRIAATCSAHKAYEELGREKYGRMLRLLHRTWAGENWSVSRNMLGGMTRFMKMYDFQDNAFVKAFREVTKREIIREAARFPGMTKDGAFATALGEIFDRNSASGLRPIA